MRSGIAAGDLLAGLPPEARERARPCPRPEWIPPMLATLTQRRFRDPDWIFERKLDGERCLGFVSAAGVPLRFTVHRRCDGRRFLEEACRSGWAGLVGKRNRQEMVVGGFTGPRGSRVGFGAMLLGHHEGDRLVYAGRVGTGYDTATLGDLRARLDALVQPGSPFAGRAGRRPGVHWVRPELVAEVEFAEWTEDGRLRHPRFVGLRDDKPASEVVRERAIETAG